MSAPATADRRIIQLTSPKGAFTVRTATLGARVSSVEHTATATEFLLNTPWAGEDWSDGYATEDSNAEWHRRYPGGWHTLVPHAGDARVHDGVQHPFHGEAAWRHWRVVEQSGHACVLELELRTVPFSVRRRIEATETGVLVHQRVANDADRPFAFSWTEHPAFSGALIGPGSTVTVGGDPIAACFPADGAAHGGFQTFRVGGRGIAELRNDHTGAAATLRWDPELFPYLYVWQEHRNTTGFPWWGRIDTIALEPASRPYFSDGDSLGPLELAAGEVLAASFELELAPGRVH